jgi:transposase-like protein
MTAVVDIGCPECRRTEPVRKRGIDRYHCTDCDVTFSHEALL